MDIRKYFDAHSRSSNHMEKLKRDKVCGCYCCLAIFPPEEIKEWIVADNPVDRLGTAICPYCEVDSVISESSGMPITKEFLREMNKIFF